jgi:hypothetical protein
MLEKTWSKIFSNFRDAKMIVLEWDKERRGKYESEESWDRLISDMYNIEISNAEDFKKVELLMSTLCQMLLVDTGTFPRTWIMQTIPETRNKINYYKNNPEEKE